MYIGDRWAAKIYKAFLTWAKTVRVSEALEPLKSFGLLPYIRGAFLEAIRSRSSEIQRLTNLGIRYDLVSPEAIEYINTYGALRVRYVDETVREAIRTVVRRGVLEGLTMQEQANIIKQFIPLHPIQIERLLDLQAALQKQGVSASEAREMLDAQRDAMLKYRATTIAITEGHTAANEGFRAANAEAVKRGVLDPDKHVRIWITTPDERRCPFCRNMDRVEAELPNGTFPGGFRGPPLHPRCRCSEAVVRK